MNRRDSNRCPLCGARSCAGECLFNSRRTAPVWLSVVFWIITVAAIIAAVCGLLALLGGYIYTSPEIG